MRSKLICSEPGGLYGEKNVSTKMYLLLVLAIMSRCFLKHWFAELKIIPTLICQMNDFKKDMMSFLRNRL